jgi:hypothetical protein
MYVQSGRHARHFLVNQPAAFDGRLVVGLYREQIVMTEWGTRGIFGGGKVCGVFSGDWRHAQRLELDPGYSAKVVFA